MEDNYWKNPDDIFAANNDSDGRADVAPQEAKPAPRKFNVGNDRDRKEYWQLLKIKALINNPDAIAKDVPSKPKESNIVRDGEGNLSGVKRSVINGPGATVKNQVELLKALRAQIHKQHDIRE